MSKAFYAHNIPFTMNRQPAPLRPLARKNLPPFLGGANWFAEALNDRSRDDQGL